MYFRPPRLQGGLFVNCDITSTLPKMLCDIMSTLSWSKIWTVWHKIFGLICDVLPPTQQTVDVLSQDFCQHICHVQPDFQQNVDICHTTISAHLWCPAACSANCGCLVTGSMKKYWWCCQKEKSRKSHETVLLNDIWTIPCLSRAVLYTLSSYMWKWAEMGEFFGKMDLLLRWDEMSQQSWMKNSRTKCHRLWDEISQWDGLSHCDKPSKFTRSESHNLGWTDNVTVVKCHSRWFVGWTLSVGQNVAWSVCGCTLSIMVNEIDKS
jgi:hypothetical protein